MEFSRTNPTPDLPILRLTSEQGRWELGLRPMLYGVRVSLGVIGDGGFCVDYCAGANAVFALELLVTMVMILRQFPEDMPWHELARQFPKYDVKPIDRDPHCWPQLQAMALTWECQCCGKERPDRHISVWRVDVSHNHGAREGTIGVNLRYCNDSPDCIERVRLLGVGVFHPV